MTDQVDVSVLIPVLNEEAHLRSAAEAMLAQDFPGRAEFLFIDGGSADASVAILHDLAAADDRVRVLANPARRTPRDKAWTLPAIALMPSPCFPMPRVPAA